MIRRRARHLHEDRLYECYLAARGDGVVDPPVAEHLADCTACQGRYADLSRIMDNVRQSADEATSALFGEERLEAQRTQIARRLEQLGHAARILSFPARVEPGDDARPQGVVASGWLVASAAAGLLLGIGLTSLYDIEFHHPTVATSAQAVVATPAPTPAAVPAASAIDDDVFLSRVDEAINRSRNRALEPFQTLTPTYREISATER